MQSHIYYLYFAYLRDCDSRYLCCVCDDISQCFRLTTESCLTPP